MKKSAEMRLVELRFGRSVESLLIDSLRAGKTQSEIACELDVAEPTVNRWVRLCGLRRDWVTAENEPVGAPR